MVLSTISVLSHFSILLMKGMKVILDERGLWQSGLLAQCKDFKCAEGSTDCCARRILFNQPDFVNVKSHLQEVITA